MGGGVGGEVGGGGDFGQLGRVAAGADAVDGGGGGGEVQGATQGGGGDFSGGAFAQEGVAMQKKQEGGGETIPRAHGVGDGDFGGGNGYGGGVCGSGFGAVFAAGHHDDFGAGGEEFGEGGFGVLGEEELGVFVAEFDDACDLEDSGEAAAEFVFAVDEGGADVRVGADGDLARGGGLGDAFKGGAGGGVQRQRADEVQDFGVFGEGREVGECEVGVGGSIAGEGVGGFSVFVDGDDGAGAGFGAGFFREDFHAVFLQRAAEEFSIFVGGDGGEVCGWRAEPPQRPGDIQRRPAGNDAVSGQNVRNVFTGDDEHNRIIREREIRRGIRRDVFFSKKGCIGEKMC